MTRCKHENGELIEFVIVAHTWDAIDGKLDGMNPDVGDIQGYEYKCNDCGRHWRYECFPKQQWLQRIHNQIT